MSGFKEMPMQIVPQYGFFELSLKLHRCRADYRGRGLMTMMVAAVADFLTKVRSAR